MSRTVANLFICWYDYNDDHDDVHDNGDEEDYDEDGDGDEDYSPRSLLECLTIFRSAKETLPMS